MGSLFVNMQIKIKLAAIAPLLIATSLAAGTPIHRRPLTRAEIAAAIQKSLVTNGFSTEPPLSPADITIISPVAVTGTHPNLEVTQIEARPVSNTTHVALWTISEPRIPPFWVTVDRKLESVAVTNKRADDAGPTEAPVAPPSRRRKSAVKEDNERIDLKIANGASALRKPQAPVLVHAGNPIQVIVQGAGMRIMTKGKALQTGRADQQIRVQIEPSGKILAARIVTAQTAEIDY
ncbi:MAG: flagella basal body P-ring formation protein FlgA [Candidatus Acidiferrales bacterium]